MAKPTVLPTAVSGTTDESVSTKSEEVIHSPADVFKKVIEFHSVGASSNAGF
jgi:hypothetical protein